jgi:hypothetical protein
VTPPDSLPLWLVLPLSAALTGCLLLPVLADHLRTRRKARS